MLHHTLGEGPGIPGAVMGQRRILRVEQYDIDPVQQRVSDFQQPVGRIPRLRAQHGLQPVGAAGIAEVGNFAVDCLPGGAALRQMPPFQPRALVLEDLQAMAQAYLGRTQPPALVGRQRPASSHRKTIHTRIMCWGDMFRSILKFFLWPKGSREPGTAERNYLQPCIGGRKTRR